MLRGLVKRSQSKGNAMSAALKLALGSLLVGVVVLGLKGLAWWITGSILRWRPTTPPRWAAARASPPRTVVGGDETRR